MATSYFKSACLALLLFVTITHADVYLHNPRGSNNRLNSEGVNRRNANRLFNSQNNAKGGYNVGELYENKTTNWYHMQYFMSGAKSRQEGSTEGRSFLSIEWTNQHGCGDDDLNCNIVLQYMCQPTTVDDRREIMTDGTSEGTPRFRILRPRFRTLFEKVDQRRNRDAVTGGCRNEPWEWHYKCNVRSRNQGLFTADQNLNGNTARYTRQNAGGTRYGYECSEERDYYPYFHPTPWTDIAVLANSVDECEYYRNESFNTKPKGDCMQLYNSGIPWNEQTNPWRYASSYNTKESCEQNNHIWVEFSNFLEITSLTKDECTAAVGPSGERLIWAIPYRTKDLRYMPGPDPEGWKKCLVALDPPDCRAAPRTRINHLGNSEDVKSATYDWTLPHFPSGQEQRCVLRIRYNISTNDYDVANTFSDQNGDQSPIKNDPRIQFGRAGDNKVPLQLAINTAQFGRTFQDRSHIFHLIPRKNHFENSNIHNWNVRGKRGNIVEAYPAVEYDFVPKRLMILPDDLVHIQWTGSNANPAGFAGEGRARTDRSNMVAMAAPDLSKPLTEGGLFDDATIVEALDPRGAATATAADLAVAMATAGYFTSTSEVPSPFQVEECNEDESSTLDCYSPSFAGYLLRFSQTGRRYVKCTRNNSFTNRSQKGRLIIIDDNTS